MIFQVDYLEDFLKFAQELKESNADGLLLKETLIGKNELSINIKLCLQTNITNVWYESSDKDSPQEYRQEEKRRLVKEIEGLFGVCEVETLNVNTVDISNVLF